MAIKYSDQELLHNIVSGGYRRDERKDSTAHSLISSFYWSTIPLPTRSRMYAEWLDQTTSRTKEVASINSLSSIITRSVNWKARRSRFDTSCKMKTIPQQQVKLQCIDSCLYIFLWHKTTFLENKNTSACHAKLSSNSPELRSTIERLSGVLQSDEWASYSSRSEIIIYFVRLSSKN